MALKNISYEEEKRKKLIYVCSSFSGETEINIKKAQKYCKFAIAKGFIPIATNLLFPQFMNDEDYHERQIVLNMGFEIILRCDELWSFGSRLSDGMAIEIERAKKLSKKVRCFTRECQ